MKKYISAHCPLWLLLVLMLPLFSACDDGNGLPVSEGDILGIWQDEQGHYLDFVNPDLMYEYNLTDFGNGTYVWVKRKEMYFFEPYSYLLLKEDSEGIMQLYKVVSVNESTMVLSWIETPEMPEDDESKFSFFKIFFSQNYRVDPARNVTFHAVSRSQLDEALKGYEIIEP